MDISDTDRQTGKGEDVSILSSSTEKGLQQVPGTSSEVSLRKRVVLRTARRPAPFGRGPALQEGTHKSMAVYTYKVISCSNTSSRTNSPSTSSPEGSSQFLSCCLLENVPLRLSANPTTVLEIVRPERDQYNGSYSEHQRSRLTCWTWNNTTPISINSWCKSPWLRPGCRHDEEAGLAQWEGIFWTD